MTGENKMSVSDRLAQKLMESELGSLLSEDDIILVAREAIDKAFFKPSVRTKGGGYGTDTFEPEVVTLARATFTKKFTELAEPVINEFVKSDAFLEAIASAAAKALPAVMSQHVESAMYRNFQPAMESMLNNYDFMRKFKDALVRTG
jgi:hypothetical protein